MRAKYSIKFNNNFLFGFSQTVEQNEDLFYLSNKYKRSKRKRKKIDFDYEKEFSKILQSYASIYKTSISWDLLFNEKQEVNEVFRIYYHNFLKLFKQHNIKLVLSLCTYDLPQWFIKNGGFSKKKNLSKFISFAKFVINEFSQYCDIFMIFDNPLKLIFKMQLLDKKPFKEKMINKDCLNSIVNISIANAKVIKFIKQKKINIITGLNHDFLPVVNNINSDEFSFSTGSIIDDYNYILNKSILDIFLTGNIEDFIFYSNSYGAKIKISDNDIELIKTNKIKIVGLGYVDLLKISLNNIQDLENIDEDKKYYAIENYNDQSIEQIVNGKIFYQILREFSRYFPRNAFFISNNELVQYNENSSKFNNDLIINDEYRIKYIKNNLIQLAKAISDFNLKCFGYCYGPIIDNWNDKYNENHNIGLVENISLDNHTKKYKKSFFWYCRVLKNKIIYVSENEI